MTPFAIIILTFLVIDSIANLCIGLAMYIRWSSRNGDKSEHVEVEAEEYYDFTVKDPVCISEIYRR